jgi:hypothetical protein
MGMNDREPIPASGGFASAESLGEIVSDAVRYWEPRRLAYNIVLVGVVATWLGATWPHFRGAFHIGALLPLSVLAGLANLCYCAAYLADLPMQYSPLRKTWRHCRWCLWLLGSLLAIAIANYWIADEIYPYVR